MRKKGCWLVPTIGPGHRCWPAKVCPSTVCASQLPELAAFAKAVPDLTIILNHLGAPEVGLDKFVAAALWHLDNWSTPFVSLRLHPALELFSGAAQHVAADWIDLPVGVEEADDPLGLLERPDQAVEQDPVETAIAEADARCG